MTVARLNPKGGYGGTTVALRSAGDWARWSKLLTIDVTPDTRGRVRVVVDFPVSEGAAR